MSTGTGPQIDADDEDRKPSDGSNLSEPPERQVPGDTAADPMPREVGGPSGPEPTRYGDWERKGRCFDF